MLIIGGNQHMLSINFTKLSEHATTPFQKRVTDSGFDLFTSEPITLAPFQQEGCTKALPTGIAFDIPNQVEGCVRPRSGLSLQGELLVWYGTVDQEYTGEVKVIVTNLTNKPQFIGRGFKIAQIVFTQRPYTQMKEVDEIEHKDRGEKGFGSSGNGKVTIEEPIQKTFITPEGEEVNGVEVTLFPEVGQVWKHKETNGDVRGYYLVTGLLNDPHYVETAVVTAEKVKYTSYTSFYFGLNHEKWLMSPEQFIDELELETDPHIISKVITAIKEEQ